MPAIVIKKQHNFDHFELHIFAQIYIFFFLKIGECLFLHGSLVFSALLVQNDETNLMLKLQLSKKCD